MPNLILLCSVKTYLSSQTWKHFCKRTWAILFVFFFFSGGHLSTHCFQYLRHLSIFFNSFFLFFMNNFCIAHACFLQQNFWEIAIRTWSIYLVDEKPIKHVFVFTPSVGAKHFWVDLDGRHVFVPTPSVGVVHMWVEGTWSWF